MNEEQKRCLQKNLLLLATELDIAPVLLFLKGQEIFFDHHEEEIKAQKTAMEQRQKLISILKQRGPNAFNAFHHALIFANQSHLAQLLQPYISLSSSKRPPPPADDSGRSSPIGRSRSPSPEAPQPPMRANSQRLPPEGGATGGLREDEAPTVIPEIPITPEAVEFARRYYEGFTEQMPTVRETSGPLELEVEEVDANFAMTNPFNPEDMYQNFTNPRGLAIIFNNRKFKGMPERFGTDVDTANLSNLLRKLNYSVKIKHNLSAHDMRKAMVRFALKDEHRTKDSCVVAVLSHGENGMIYGSDDVMIPVNQLVGYLSAESCPELAGKPKLFFLQACRGERYDPGVDHKDGNGMDGGDTGVARSDQPDAPHFLPDTLLEELRAVDIADGGLQGKVSKDGGGDSYDAMPGTAKRRPNFADMLIAYATTPGYVSWRNSAKGSWFMQSICHVFARYAATEDILSMLTRVNRRVAEVFESSSGAYKQVPEPSYSLTKKFFFFPGYGRN